MRSEKAKYVACIAIGLLVAGGGVAHFTHPGFFQALVPMALDDYRSLVNAATGVLQIAMGAAFLVPRLRTLARWSTIALLVATLPAAFDQIVHPEVIQTQGISSSIAILRLIAQIAMIVFIWWATLPDQDRGRGPSHVP